MGGDSVAWQASYQDPLRWKFPDSTEEFQLSGEPRVDEYQTEACSMKVVMMHRPTHMPAREKTGEYPYSWHLSGKKRLWEFRLQLRFKSLPTGQTYFGIELGRYVPVTGLARGVQKALVSACQGIVGDCYHTQGDDPTKTQGEVEAPAFVMPLWAFDQFQVADPGEEPDLTGDMNGVGQRRSGDVRGYIKAMRGLIDSLSTEKVYTFCFWGVSKFLDVMRWRVKMGGGLAGKLTDGMDFNKLCGSPPVYLTMYELPGVSPQDRDRRHLASRKRRFFRAEVWSTVSPPHAAAEATLVQEEPEDASCYDYWCGTTGYEGYEDMFGSNGMVAPPVSGDFDDPLGLNSSPPEPSKLEPGPEKPRVETVDLLGLEF